MSGLDGSENLGGQVEELVPASTGRRIGASFWLHVHQTSCGPAVGVI